MRLTFVYNIKLSETQEKIIKEIKWHCSKVYNTFNYEIREGKVDVSKIKRVNEDSSKIYKSYRKENWHSKYLHSHTLEQIILNCIRDHKSYLALEEMYEEGNKDIKERPQMPRYKNNGKVQTTFTKYAIRKDGREIKLSISKEKIRRASKFGKHKNDKDRKYSRWKM